MNIAEEPIFGMHLGTEADPKIDPIQDSIDKTFPHPEYFSYLIGVKSESGVSDNPYGVLETLLGGVQRTINMEQKMSEVLLEESIPLIIKEIELEKDIQAVDLGSIESGIIPTYGSYDSIFIFQMKGKLLPNSIDRVNNNIQFPESLSIAKINPITKDRSSISLSQTPFTQRELSIQTADINAFYTDRAVGVMYDPRTDTTFVGISRGVLFDSGDVQKTKELNDAGGTFRVSDIMAKRLISEGKLMQIQDKYYVIRNGILTDEEFNIQNPQKYINPDFPREKQIGEMTDILLAEMKKNWEANNG